MISLLRSVSGSSSRTSLDFYRVQLWFGPSRFQECAIPLQLLGQFHCVAFRLTSFPRSGLALALCSSSSSRRLRRRLGTSGRQHKLSLYDWVHTDSSWPCSTICITSILNSLFPESLTHIVICFVAPHWWFAYVKRVHFGRGCLSPRFAWSRWFHAPLRRFLYHIAQIHTHLAWYVTRLGLVA